MEFDPYDNGNEKFLNLVSESGEFFKERQDEFMSLYGFQKYNRFYFRQCDGTVFFFDEHDTPIIGFKYQSVGSYSPVEKTWLWSWANVTNTDQFPDTIQKLLDIGRNEGFIALTTPKWKCDIDDANVMASIFAFVNDAVGVYRSTVLYRDVKKELISEGIEFPADKENDYYLYCFEAFMDILDGKEIGIYCVKNRQEKCPGMIIDGGNCPY